MADQLEQLLRELDQPVHPRAEFGDQLLGRLVGSLGDSRAEEPARRRFPAVRELAFAAMLVLFIGALVVGAYTLRAARHPAPVRTAPTNQTLPIQGVSFLNAQDGAVVTERGLFITHDGGEHWQLALKLDGKSLNELRFVDANHIVVLSGVPIGVGASRGKQLLQATADGGAHWTSSPIAAVPVQGRSELTFFLNAREGWLQESSNIGSLQAPTTIAIYHSTDAGAHWTQIARVDTAHPSSQGLRLDLIAAIPTLVVTDSKHGFMEVQSQDGVGRLYVSPDGGRTWKLVELPAPPGGWFSRGGVIGPTMFGARGVVVAPWAAIGSYTYTTDDGGLTWANPRRLPGGDFKLPGRGISWLDAFDSSHWWALIDNDLYQTADAGQSWLRVPSQLPAPADGFLSVNAVGGQVVLATVEATLEASAKAGVRVSACVGGGSVVAGPACEFLVRSTDGGINWTVVKLPAG